MKTYVIYHAPCYDGFGAAFSAWKELGDFAEYIPMSYSTKIDPSRFEKGSLIYFVDFSAKPDVMQELGEGRIVIVLDHHKTAEANLAEFVELPIDFHIDSYESYDPGYGVHVRFDMEKSGAMLAWEYFNPGTKAPKLIEYIQDRDLWQFKLTSSHEFSAHLRVFDFDFDTWDHLARDLQGEVLLRKFCETGAVCLAQDEMTTKLITKKAMVSDYNGVKVAYCTASSHWSEVGNYLLEMFPEADMALSFCLLPEHGSFMGSCRSNGFDVSKWCQENFDGGGHPKAAGFNLNWDQGLGVLMKLKDNQIAKEK